MQLYMSRTTQHCEEGGAEVLFCAAEALAGLKKYDGNEVQLAHIF